MEILVSIDAELKCSKDIFLSNPRNKQRFIVMLGEELKKRGIEVIQCEKDADVHVVKCAMNHVTLRNVILVGDDTDLLVISMHYTHSISDSFNKRNLPQFPHHETAIQFMY